MFRHLFKMIWNKKKQNSLLIIEMLVSFLVVFAVFTLLVFYYKNYRQPLGMQPDTVWVINYNNPNTEGSLDSLTMLYESVRQQLKSLPQIEEVSYVSNNIPFALSTNNGTLHHNKSEIPSVNRYTAEDDYDNVMGFKLEEGRWFTKEDRTSRDRPVVITANLKQKLFGANRAVGNLIGEGNENEPRKRIVGVIRDIKDDGDYQAAKMGIFERADSGAARWLSRILIKVAADAGPDFESRLHRMLSSSLKDSNVEIEHLAEKRISKNKISLIPMIILLIVAGFLIVNVALGLFGVLWYNISRRRGEIGLRRAVGASSAAISKQLVGEALVLSTLSLIIGSFFAVQFPLLNVFDLPSGVYLMALILSIAFIYALVLICAFYPGKQAAAILPAVALHEE